MPEPKLNTVTVTAHCTEDTYRSNEISRTTKVEVPSADFSDAELVVSHLRRYAELLGEQIENAAIFGHAVSRVLVAVEEAWAPPDIFLGDPQKVIGTPTDDN